MSICLFLNNFKKLKDFCDKSVDKGKYICHSLTSSLNVFKYKQTATL